jgi:hypothetical protein
VTEAENQKEIWQTHLREKSPLNVLQAGAHFSVPLMIAGDKVSRSCALSEGSQIFMASASVSRHEDVLQFFLTCGFTVCVFESLQDAQICIENGAMRCDLLFLDADSCADVGAAHNALVRLQAAVPKLPVIVASVIADTARSNPVLNHLLNTVICLPADDRALFNAVAMAVTNSLR